MSQSELAGIAAIADSPDEVRLRAREQLRQGASQIKLMGGGGVSSPHNPIESTQFTEAELHAAVEAAENWGTYVAVHAYTPAAIRQAIAAGVKCIEHGQLIDEPTAKLLADKGIWWSLQPLTYDADSLCADEPGVAEEGAGSVRGNRERLQAREEVQDQDGLGRRYPGRCGGCQPAGAISRHDGPLVHACRSAQDGHRRQWRVDGALRASSIPIPASSASWKWAHLQICCWSMAIPSTTSTSSQIPTRILSSS